jgi:HlyD family secretion protein
MAEESASRVEVARSEMERSILLAPFDGIVAELNAEMGEMVTPSPPGIPTPPAVDFIEEGCMYVTAPIDEIDGRSVRTGQPARITLDAYPGERFEGTVRRVAPYVLDREKQARTLEVEVAIDDPASIPGLVPGFSADVEILLERREGVLRVPAEALSGTDRVMLLEGDHLGERKIATGIANWQYVEVTSGLGEGDLIVLSLDRAGVQAGARAVAGQPPSP